MFQVCVHFQIYCNKIALRGEGVCKCSNTLAGYCSSRFGVGEGREWDKGEGWSACNR